MLNSNMTFITGLALGTEPGLTGVGVTALPTVVMGERQGEESGGGRMRTRRKPVFELSLQLSLSEDSIVLCSDFI